MRDVRGTIRLAEPSDLTAVAELYHRVWHETHSSRMPDVERSNRNRLYFVERVAALMPNVVVSEGGAIRGFAAWSGNLLGQIFVDAEYRGGGIASELLAAAESGMRDQGVREAELHCLVGNERARRFYEREGWTMRDTIHEDVDGRDGKETRPFWVLTKHLQ